MSDIINNLKRQLEGFDLEIKSEKIGRVLEVGDGIVRITGLSEATSQEMLEFETDSGPVTGLAFNLEEDNVGAVILGDYLPIKEGAVVRSLGRALSIQVGRELIGRVVNPLGQPVDGGGPIFADQTKPVYFPVERPAPPVTARTSVDTPFHTGLKVIDSMIPIGRGQRELIIGDRGTGKTAIAIDAIINQQQEKKHRRPVCVYVAIGQKESKIAKIVEVLRKTGALKYTIVVAAPAAAPAAFCFLAPYAGCAIGEYFMEQGQDAVVIYDDLSKQAWAYRELSLLLRRPPGREAYPGDIFYLHSRLLERAARLNQENGGGSLTALPIVETQLGDVSAYIPTNVISITDGQIYLEPELFNQGIRPAVNVGLSVSRVGSAAQTKAMKRVAGRLRLELAQFRELAAFAQFAADLDDSTRKRIKRGEALTQILRQDEQRPLSFDRQVAVIFAASQGVFDQLPMETIRLTTERFLDYLQKMKSAVLQEISNSGQLNEKTESQLKQAWAEFAALSAPPNNGQPAAV